MNHRILVLIPARYESSRFPGKPLALVSGKTLIERVAENCSQANQLGQDLFIEYAVVTDDDRIEEHLKEKNMNVVRVDDDVVSGTERIALAQKRFFNESENGDWDLIVNLQGDEPLFGPELLCEFSKFCLSKDFDISTIIRPRQDLEGAGDTNIVKCVFEEETHQCLYFSRAMVPFANSTKEYAERGWFQHIGVYAFRPNALQKFSSLPVAEVEKRERLEQLRAMSHGMSIGAMKSDVTLLGVDTPEDVAKVEKILS